MAAEVSEAEPTCFNHEFKGSSRSKIELNGASSSSRFVHDITFIRARDFPQLDASGRVYLDSAATTQEPLSVITQMYQYRREHVRGSNHSKNSCEARAIDAQVENARKKIKAFFKAQNYTVGFTSGTTDTSNFIATRFPFKKGDTLILTEMEHNSQILTARTFAKRAGAKVLYVPVSVLNGKLDLEQLKNVVSEIKSGKILLNLVHVSNVTGIINPVKEIREIIGERGFVYLDMAQSAGHIPINLDDLDVDFAGISAHKMYGPMGIGAIFINERSKRYIDNSISGGSAIEMVSRKHAAPCSSPARFEPGTQDLESAIEWGFAIDYLNNIGIENIERYDSELVQYFIEELQKILGVRIYGALDTKDRSAVVTFNIGSYLKKNYDKVARELDKLGICVRDGCFCAHIYIAQLVGLPKTFLEYRTKLMELGVSKKMMKTFGAVRVSFAFYNTKEEVTRALQAIKKIATKQRWLKL